VHTTSPHDTPADKSFAAKARLALKKETNKDITKQEAQTVKSDVKAFLRNIS
jgi:hypothetical protein